MRQNSTGPGARTDHDHGMDRGYGGNFDHGRKYYQLHSHNHAHGSQHCHSHPLRDLDSDGHHGRASGGGPQ